MGSIEVGDGAERCRVPGVDHLAGKSADVAAVYIKEVDALGVRTDVDRFRVGIVQVKLQAACDRAAQRDVEAVVGTCAGASPAPQRGELRVEKAVGLRRIAARWSSADREAKYVGIFQGHDFVKYIARKELVHGLGGS